MDDLAEQQNGLPGPGSHSSDTGPQKRLSINTEGGNTSAFLPMLESAQAVARRDDATRSTSGSTGSQDNLSADLTPRLHELYDRLERRGLEPVLPAGWAYDFLGLDRSLFVDDEDDGVTMPCIRSLSGDDQLEFRGMLAFERLLVVGKNLRSVLEINKVRRCRPKLRDLEDILRRGIQSTLDWAACDASLEPLCMPLFLPVIMRSCHSQRERFGIASATDIEALERKTQARLRRIAKVHREALALSNPTSKTPIEDTKQPVDDEPSCTTIFAFAICGPCIGIIALDSSTAERRPHTVMVADFSKPYEDLWNGLAVALTVMVARKEILACRQAGLLPALANLGQLSGLVTLNETVDEDV